MTFRMITLVEKEKTEYGDVRVKTWKALSRNFHNLDD